MYVKEYAIKAHQDTNHYYDTYLPYEFHLRMVVQVCKQFKNLVPAIDYDSVENACWLHDVMEDTRNNYNDVVGVSSVYVAEIVRAVTNNGRGRNRKERLSPECYNDMRITPHAIFVKLCDRIANVQYSKMSGSRMLDMYHKEHANFVLELDVNPELRPMWAYLHQLFN